MKSLDALIQAEVGPCACTAQDAGYNPRFIEDISTGYACVDWKLFKALLWVESGGPKNRAWKTRPFQIGNPHDKAYPILKKAAEGSAAIMSDALTREIKTGSIDTPALNVKAGIAYLFTRMAKFEIRSVLDDKDRTTYIETVRHGDSLDTIARRVGTTVEVLRKFQQSSGNLIRVGQKLQYQKARMAQVVAGWRTWDFATIADRYNGGGDVDYAEKLKYVHGLFGKLKR